MLRTRIFIKRSAITLTPDLGTISVKLLHNLSPVKFEQYMAKGREIILNQGFLDRFFFYLMNF